MTDANLILVRPFREAAKAGFAVLPAPAFSQKITAKEKNNGQSAYHG
jgi:hypothetical protein